MLVIIFSGFTAFIGGFKTDEFITSYLGVNVYLLNILIFKVCKRTKLVRPREMDLASGRRLYEEEAEAEEVKRTFAQRLASALWGS